VANKGGGDASALRTCLLLCNLAYGQRAATCLTLVWTMHMSSSAQHPSRARQLQQQWALDAVVHPQCSRWTTLDKLTKAQEGPGPRGAPKARYLRLAEQTRG